MATTRAMAFTMAAAPGKSPEGRQKEIGTLFRGEKESRSPGPGPGLGVVANVPTPYRIHLHRRLVAEIPELALTSFFTHGRADFNWQTTGIEQINPVYLASGTEDVAGAGRPGSWRREWRRGGAILDAVKRRDIRALVLNGYNDLTRLRLVAAGRRLGVPVFVRGDSNILGDLTRPPKSWIKRPLVGWVCRNAAGIMPMGRLGQRFFEKYGARPEKCFWVPYEPDYAHFARADRAELEAFRGRHGLDARRRRLLSCGRLVDVKRVDLLLDAFAAIAAERSNWDVVIAGDGPLRQALAARVPETLRGRVKWLGFLEVDAMRLAYHAADALVLPSAFEPWAVVVNEAMAAGCAVVASDVVGAAWELVEDGVSGRRFPSGDAAGLAKALRDVTDPAAIDRYRAAVPAALAAWRQKADPVAGIRAALQSAGVLGEKVSG